jgi:hypothetical protein
LAGTPNGLVSEVLAGADDVPDPGFSVPEVAHEARNPLAGMMAAAAREPRRKSRRPNGRL